MFVGLFDMLFLNVLLHEVKELVLLTLQPPLLVLRASHLILESALHLARLSPEQVHLLLIARDKVLLLPLLESLQLVETLDELRVVLSQRLHCPLRVDELEEPVYVGFNLQACEGGPLEIDPVLVELEVNGLLKNLDVGSLLLVGKGLSSEGFVGELEAAFEVAYLVNLGLEIVQLSVHEVSVLESLWALSDVAQMQWEGLVWVELGDTPLTELLVALKLSHSFSHDSKLLSHLLNQRLLSDLNVGYLLWGLLQRHLLRGTAGSDEARLRALGGSCALRSRQPRSCLLLLLELFVLGVKDVVHGLRCLMDGVLLVEAGCVPPVVVASRGQPCGPLARRSNARSVLHEPVLSSRALPVRRIVVVHVIPCLIALALLVRSEDLRVVVILIHIFKF